MNAPQLEIRGIGKAYGATVALADVSLAVERGQYVVLLGPSGSGKTTLLSILGGFVAPTTGAVLLGGVDVTEVPPAHRPTTTVFQDYALFPHMSVGGNVGFGLAMRGVGKAARHERVEAALAMVGLASFAVRRVHELSGGQRQRVALARALVVEPEVLLLDEPLGALDLNLRRQMQEELVRLQRRTGTTFVHVTHDQDEAMSLADLLVVMNAGRIEDSGPPERVYLRPATRFTAGFMGEANILPGRVRRAGNGETEIETALGVLELETPLPAGHCVNVSIRPEQLETTPPAEDAVYLGAATIAELAFHGTHFRCQLESADDAAIGFLLHLPPNAAPTKGMRLELYARRADLVVLAD